MESRQTWLESFYLLLSHHINQYFSPPFQGLIFVVDSNDRERIQEAAEELQKMVTFNQNMNIFYANVTTVFLLKILKLEYKITKKIKYDVQRHYYMF